MSAEAVEGVDVATRGSVPRLRLVRGDESPADGSDLAERPRSRLHGRRPPWRVLDRLRLHELERLRAADVPVLEAWAFVVTHPELGTRDLRGRESVTHTRAVRTLASILDRSDPDGVETARAVGLLHVCGVARDATDALRRIVRGECRTGRAGRVQLDAVRTTLEALGLL